MAIRFSRLVLFIAIMCIAVVLIPGTSRMVGAEGVPFIPPEQDCKPSELCPENDSACLHSCHAGKMVIKTTNFSKYKLKHKYFDKVMGRHDSTEPYDGIPACRRLVGRLKYLNTTRSDITFITQQLSQFLFNPSQCCPGRGSFFPINSSLQLQGFSDVDWAGCKDTRKSISGQRFFLGHSLISWRTKKQITVSRSSPKAKYRALGSTFCELQWLLYLLKDLQVTSANPVFHERTKHLEIDCHIVREKLQAGILKLLPVSSKDRIADFFTKFVHPQLFNLLLSKLGIVDIYHPPTCGGILHHEQIKEIKGS
ncbi:LCR-like protein [Medicago truncatula]|uniref:LCR-like protein n=1 Tax=Medicago truncatula TaxID=3880 RepID=G7IQZ9_MEDTR|nr:LCR-like protein [Medicago truncatula]